MHTESHEAAGDFFNLQLRGTRCLPAADLLETPFRLLDWADRMPLDKQYEIGQKDFAFNNYTRRRFGAGLPVDNEAVYGQLRGGILVVVHESELRDVRSRRIS